MIPRAIEFMVTGILPAVQGLPEYKTKNQLMPWNIAELLSQDYSQWAPGLTSATGTPIDRIFDTLGSTSNPTALVNAETHLNSVKGRVSLLQQSVMKIELTNLRIDFQWQTTNW